MFVLFKISSQFRQTASQFLSMIPTSCSSVGITFVSIIKSIWFAHFSNNSSNTTVSKYLLFTFTTRVAISQKRRRFRLSLLFFQLISSESVKVLHFLDLHVGKFLQRLEFSKKQRNAWLFACRGYHSTYLHSFVTLAEPSHRRLSDNELYFHQQIEFPKNKVFVCFPL